MTHLGTNKTSSGILKGFIAFLESENVYYDTKIDVLSGLEAEILVLIWWPSLKSKMAAFCHLDDVAPLPK